MNQNKKMRKIKKLWYYLKYNYLDTNEQEIANVDQPAIQEVGIL